MEREVDGMDGKVDGMEGRVCVITGTASGIGAATASAFKAAGATVAAIDVSAEATGDLVVHADVSDEAQVESAFAQIRERLGRIDALVNNAGIVLDRDQSVLSTDVETWQRVQDVNLRGVFLCCKHGIPHLLEGGGAVVNIASFVALMGAAESQISYTASKGAVLAMSRELGVEFADRGVRVNAICPGPIRTPLLDELFATEPEKSAKRLVHIPMGRFGEPEEIAKAALFLAGDDASFITAAALTVDGGASAAYLTPGQVVA